MFSKVVESYPGYQWYVRAYAHLEYGQGYVIFDRDDGNKEIWRRAVDIPHSPEVEIDRSSVPDNRMHSVAGYMNTLTSTHRLTTAHRNAQFTPHVLLRMPEPTRAYRHVFPTLALASLERAFLFDVRTGSQIQTLEGIQTTPPATGSGDHDHEQQPHVTDEPPLPHDTGDEDMPLDSDEEPDDVQDLSQLLGPVRYVEVSERHLFLAGPYVLRVFSRETGKAVFELPSTRLRYGRWRWELASREAVNERGGRYDTYKEAQEQNREVVRLPTRFSWEEYQTAERLVTDQFSAGTFSTRRCFCDSYSCLVHVSSDGKHLVAMLGGSRIVILPDFEEFLTRTPRIGISGHLARSSLMKRDKDREVFERTLDVQLGAPLGSSSVYLAYEHGRIGVVTVHSFLFAAYDPPKLILLPPSRPMRFSSSPQLSPTRKTPLMLPNSLSLASLISRIPLG